MPDRPLRVATAGLADHERPLADLLLADRRIAAAGLEDAELVWLGAAHADRPEAARRAVAAGLPVLQGPPADLEELDALAAAADAAGVPVAVVHRRASPPFARAAALVADGRAGLPRSVLVHLVEAGGAPPERLLFEAVDAVRAIVGLDPIAVHATEAPGDEPGAGIAIVELERDVPLTVVAGRAPGDDPIASGLRRIVLVGSQAMLALEEDRPRLEARGARARAGDGGALAARAAALAAELVGVVRERHAPACGLGAARHALAVVAGAREAARERSVVALGSA
jgi:predicted dehydrogenase